MAVNAYAAYAIYSDGVTPNAILRTLEQAGFDKENICMMLSPTHPIAMIVRESGRQPFEGETNVVLAGLIGWLSEFGAVVIPNFGFFIRSQEFFHALVVERESIRECGRRGTLVCLGFPQRDAERFEGQVREAGMLLYVSCPEVARTEWALELLRSTGAEEAGLLQNEVAAAAIA